ncbi:MULTISPECIES: helix-turn-helix transcriptional regulator [Dethiosulfovibrio]|uniref:Helix-turn-helix domain-containing protein n=3 Tax=Dethiosulfovibrio TaxID=47054 RepID=A0ABS9EMK5_9BACT|nr:MULTISPECIES: helix-turn-helix domain-containing protein [Dethiosulfovibrio]MCF4142414.1 helix-turn-helix domain-containing protein [Dethiosulfovibrio marinus]MCF4145385.1 helix-turn-helix domain-containing protein [Dethiosulfovibrio acidaminovorans]
MDLACSILTATGIILMYVEAAMDGELVTLSDMSFPVSVLEHVKIGGGPLFEPHFHDHHLQFFRFLSGRARIFCDQREYEMESSEVLIVNRGELHYGEGLSDELRYFVFRIDIDLLSSYGIFPCGERYLSPLRNGLVTFRRRPVGDGIRRLLDSVVERCRRCDEGYELGVLGGVFGLLEELFRSCGVMSLVSSDVEILMRKRQALSAVFEYVEKNYREGVSLPEAADIAHMSVGHLCRLFRRSTGRTFVDYVNRMRVEKAAALLSLEGCNVTEAAMSVGFDDVGYFSRVFKKYMTRSPRQFIGDDRRYFL